MRIRIVLLLSLALAALLPLVGCSPATPTEAKAIAAAKNDHTAYTLPPQKLAKAVRISHFYDAMYFAGVAWGIVAVWLLLRLGIAARMRDVALRFGSNPWAQGCAFMGQLLLLMTLLNLPLGMAAHHASVGFGFSIQGWASWFADQGKNFLISYAIGTLFAMLLYFLMRKFPQRWWLWLWFPTMLTVLAGVYLTPYLIDPLFNKFEPLSQANPALVEQLEKVAAHGRGIDIPPERIFLMKASEKTTLLNAYVTGFGSSKRLVIWDTLLAKATPDEVAIIAGHEMGHYVLGHIVRGILLSFAGILAAFYVGFQVFQLLLRRFGTRWRIVSQQDWAALVILLLVFHALSFLAQPIANGLSRRMEHDADVFGQEAVHGIVADPQATGQATEQMLGEAYDANPEPSNFVEFWTDSHPSTPFRAAFSKHYDPWAPGEKPKYFSK